MATTKKTTEEVVEEVTSNTADPEELVPFSAPISREQQTDIFVSVNGENIQIQRGKQVMIKRKFYDVLMNSQRMDNLAFERQRDLENNY